MSRGKYKIEATRYHAALPPTVQRLNVGDKEIFGVWGYEIKKTEIPAGKVHNSENFEMLVKDLVIHQIRADPEMKLRNKLVHVVLEMSLESMPIAQSRPKFRGDGATIGDYRGRYSHPMQVD